MTLDSPGGVPPAARLPHPRRHYTDGPFGQIHFQSLGEGPPLILLHQAPMTSNQFDNVYAPLARRGLRAIGIDMPGFGMSDATPGVPTIADYAQVVGPVLDALQLGQAAILGHHTGALAATEAALRIPERISALVVNGPLLTTDEDRRDFLQGLHSWERGYAAQAAAGHMVELFEIRDRLAGGTVPADRLSDYVVQALTGKGAFWYGHHAAYMYDHAVALQSVRQPTLILTNTGDQIYAHALKAHALRPDFAFQALQGGGIDIVDQQPEAWADAVADFLGSTVSGHAP